MPRPLAQLLGIALYEIRIHWRSRTLLVIFLALAVLMVVSMLIYQTNTVPVVLDTSNAVAALISAPLLVTLAMLLPIAIADTIPRDSAYGVRELLETLPVPPAVYLAGKVVGLWLSALIGLVVLMVAVGAAYYGLLGAFNIGQYLEMWLSAALLLVIINGALGVLLPVGQTTRRRAVIIMIALFMLPIAAVGQAFEPDSILYYLNPVRPAVIFHYVGQMGQEAGKMVPAFQSREVLRAFIVGLIELAVVWIVVAWWARRKEFSR